MENVKTGSKSGAGKEDMAEETEVVSTKVDKPAAEKKSADPPKPEYGAGNKVFTQDAADKARERLKKRLGTPKR